MEVTMKNSTKQQIMDAYLEAKKQLDAIEAMKDDPMTQVAKQNKVKDAEVAGQLIEKHILSAEIESQYQSLCNTISDMKKELEDLYGIKAEANSFTAMINAHKLAKKECIDEYNTLKKTCKEEYDALKKEKEQEITDLNKTKQEVLQTTRTEDLELRNALKIQRTREEEEYNYKLKRVRQADDDTWNDKVAKREKELLERETAVQELTAEINKKADYVIELENKVEALTKQLDEKYLAGKKDGKAEADKSNAFEVRTLNMKNEFEQKNLQAKVEAETDRANKAETKASELQNKLDQAYAQMRDLAAETVKSSGGVKILDRETSGK